MMIVISFSPSPRRPAVCCVLRAACCVLQVTVAMGKNDVTMKIADEGGGASRSEMNHLWTYYYTTANKFLVGNAHLPVGACLLACVGCPLSLSFSLSLCV